MKFLHRSCVLAFLLTPSVVLSAPPEEVDRGEQIEILLGKQGRNSGFFSGFQRYHPDDFSTDAIRRIAMRLRYGSSGPYKSASTLFTAVHLRPDGGEIRLLDRAMPILFELLDHEDEHNAMGVGELLANEADGPSILPAFLKQMRAGRGYGHGFVFAHWALRIEPQNTEAIEHALRTIRSGRLDFDRRTRDKPLAGTLLVSQFLHDFIDAPWVVQLMREILDDESGAHFSTALGLLWKTDEGLIREHSEQLWGYMQDQVVTDIRGDRLGEIKNQTELGQHLTPTFRRAKSSLAALSRLPITGELKTFCIGMGLRPLADQQTASLWIAAADDEENKRLRTFYQSEARLLASQCLSTLAEYAKSDRELAMECIRRFEEMPFAYVHFLTALQHSDRSAFGPFNYELQAMLGEEELESIQTRLENLLLLAETPSAVQNLARSIVDVYRPQPRFEDLVETARSRRSRERSQAISQVGALRPWKPEYWRFIELHLTAEDQECFQAALFAAANAGEHADVDVDVAIEFIENRMSAYDRVLAARTLGFIAPDDPRVESLQNRVREAWD